MNIYMVVKKSDGHRAEHFAYRSTGFTEDDKLVKAYEHQEATIFSLLLYGKREFNRGFNA